MSTLVTERIKAGADWIKDGRVVVDRTRPSPPAPLPHLH